MDRLMVTIESARVSYVEKKKSTKGKDDYWMAQLVRERSNGMVEPMIVFGSACEKLTRGDVGNFEVMMNAKEGQLQSNLIGFMPVTVAGNVAASSKK